MRQNGQRIQSECTKCGASLRPYWLKNGICNACRNPHLVVQSVSDPAITIEIRKCAYLKNPKWKWTIHNDVGGSFSNSGEYRSLRALGKAFLAQYPSTAPTAKVRMVTIHDIGHETIYEMDWKTMFGEKL